MDGMTWLFLVCSITVAWLPRGAGQPPLQETLRANSHKEAPAFCRKDSAARVNDTYHKALNAA